MLKRITLLFTLILYLGSLSLIKAQTIAPKYSNEFLSIGVDARSVALSRTSASFVNDATAAYWNPAGLVHIKEPNELALMHSSYFGGIANYNYASFANRIDSSNVLSFSVIRFGVDDIPDTRYLFDADGNLNYDNVRSFSAVDYALMASLGHRSSKIEGLYIGGSVKLIHRNVGTFANAWGFGFDLGVQYHVNDWKLAVVGKDITTTFNAWSINSAALVDAFVATDNVIPDNSVELTMPRVIFEGSRLWTFKEKWGLNVALGADITLDGKRNTLIKTNLFSIDPHAGCEISYKSKVFLRAGIGEYQQIKAFDGSLSGVAQPNIGIGVQLKNVKVDYALTNIGGLSPTLNSHLFSILFAFDVKDIKL